MRFVQRGYLATLVGHIVGAFLGGWFTVIMAFRSDGNMWEELGVLLLGLFLAVPAGVLIGTALTLRIFRKPRALLTAVTAAGLFFISLIGSLALVEQTSTAGGLLYGLVAWTIFVWLVIGIPLVARFFTYPRPEPETFATADPPSSDRSR